MSRSRRFARTRRIQRLRALRREERRQNFEEGRRLAGLLAYTTIGTLDGLRAAIVDIFEGRATGVDAVETGIGDVRVTVTIAPGHNRLDDEEIAKIAIDEIRPAGVRVFVEIRRVSP